MRADRSRRVAPWRPGAAWVGGLVAVALFWPASVSADADAEALSPIVVVPDEIEWGAPPPKLPPGAEFAVLLGDPSRPGELYVFRAKLPVGYAVPPHVHPMDEHVTVVEGTMVLGFGAARDESLMRELPAGSYVKLPQGVPHFNRMKGPTILQFHGIGPFDIVYLDPKDDPTQRPPAGAVDARSPADASGC